MAKERSGNPSSDNSGDLHHLFPGSESSEGVTRLPPEEWTPAPPPAENPAEPAPLAADGWPTWMGDADPSMRPVQPSGTAPRANPPRTAAQRRKPAVGNPPPQSTPARAPAPPAKLAAPVERSTERKSAPAVKAAPPAKALPAPAALTSERGRPKRWLRSFICAFAVLVAILAGEIGAQYRPETALRFQQMIGDVRDHLPATVPPGKLATIGAGVALALYGIVVWQAGLRRRPLFLPVALLLCLSSGAFGLFRGGNDLGLERSAAFLKAKTGSLEKELGSLRMMLDHAMTEGTKAKCQQKELEEWQKAAMKQLADKDQAMSQALEGLEGRLREQTVRAQEAQADRDKATGSLQQSSVVHQAALKEKDEVLSALRKEIEELKRKLAEKN